MKASSDLLVKNDETFSQLINIIYKATENYQKIFSQNISDINQIITSIENNLQSISSNKITNIKSLINLNHKGFLTYINDTKISLNKILLKSKEISLEIMSFNQKKSSIDIDILSSEIKQKEDEIKNLKKEMNYFKDKFNSVNQSFSEAQKTISELKEENFSYQEKMIENEKNFYINNNSARSEKLKIPKEIYIGEVEKNQISELKNKIKELNNEIDKKKKEYETGISRMSDKNTNLSKFLNQKNQEVTKLQNENIDKIKENNNLKNQLKKKNLKESEYMEKISEYQKQIEINDKDINNKNTEIISLTDNINNNKILIKSLETEIEKLKYEKNNNFTDNETYMNILSDLEKCKKEKEEIENELENIKKITENEKNEYKKKLNLMESTIYNDNILINKKDELIEQLKIKHQNLKNSIANSNININNVPKEQNIEMNTKIKELENEIKQKDEKITELNNIIESNKKEENFDISNIKKTLHQYKEEIEANHSVINLLKEQIKSIELENKNIKGELKKKNTSELFEMTEKTIKLQKELDKYRSKSQIPNLEKKYSELESEYQNEKKKYQNEIMELKTELLNLKAKIEEKEEEKKDVKEEEGNNKININNNSKKGKYLINTSSNFNLEDKYNKTLEKLKNANNENQKLKKRIEQLEKQRNNMQKESLFKYRSNIENEDYEEEIDMMQLKEGLRRKNRSEDFKIDYPGYNEYQKKYEEIEDKFNKLKELVIPLLKDNIGNNDKLASKDNINKICNLLGASVNTTNNILQNYE